MDHNRAVGRRGEDAAAVWYATEGYQVLARNWRCAEGELDLIVSDGSCIVVVEVKARSSTRFGSGVDAVDWRKQGKLRQLAQRWLSDADRFYDEVRFDVVDVDGRGHLIVYEDCF